MHSVVPWKSAKFSSGFSVSFLNVEVSKVLNELLTCHLRSLMFKRLRSQRSSFHATSPLQNEHHLTSSFQEYSIITGKKVLLF